MTHTSTTSSEVCDFDVEDAALDIEHSMASDDRQTRKEYQAGCKALRALTDELARLRSTIATLEAEREATRQALKSYLEQFDFEHRVYADGDDEYDCPQDDTCECEYIEAFNNALRPRPRE